MTHGEFFCRGNSACGTCGEWNYTIRAEADVEKYWNGGTVRAACANCGAVSDVCRK